MSNAPTIKQLQYLLALNKAGSFHKAAANCFVSQSTLSAGLKEMEILLGQDVIDRRNRKKLRLTPFGEDVLKTAKTILSEIENLTARATSLQKPLSGPLSIGLIPTIAPYLIPTLLPLLQKSFKDIEFKIVEDLTANLIEKLNDGLIDMAIIAFPFETNEFNTQIFYEETFFCAAQKGHFKNRKTLTLKDLDNQNLLLLEDGHCLRDHALSACRLQNYDEKKVLSATSLLTLIQMVSQGHGITLLPEMVIEQSVLPKNLALHGFKSPRPTRQIGAIWNKNAPNKKNIEAILTEISKNLP